MWLLLLLSQLFLGRSTIADVPIELLANIIPSLASSKPSNVVLTADMYCHKKFRSQFVWLNCIHNTYIVLHALSQSCLPSSRLEVAHILSGFSSKSCLKRWVNNAFAKSSAHLLATSIFLKSVCDKPFVNSLYFGDLLYPRNAPGITYGIKQLFIL